MINNKLSMKGFVEIRQYKFKKEAYQLLEELRKSYPNRDTDPKQMSEYQALYNEVVEKFAEPKYYKKQNFLDKLLKKPIVPFFPITANIITSRGDALIVQALANTRVETPINNTYGRIGLGTGFASATKTSSGLVTQTGTYATMDSGYPALGATYNQSGDNIVKYHATWPVGSLNAVNINEAALTNGTWCAAYTNINTTTVESTDTIQIRWLWVFSGTT